MNGPSFEIMKKISTIVLGQIVVDEVCNKYREKAEEQFKAAQKAVSELNKFLSAPMEIPSQNIIDTEHKNIRTFSIYFALKQV